MHWLLAYISEKKYYYNFQAVPKTFWQLLTELPLHIVKQNESIFPFTYMC